MLYQIFTYYILLITFDWLDSLNKFRFPLSTELPACYLSSIVSSLTLCVTDMSLWNFWEMKIILTTISEDNLVLQDKS